MAEAKKRVTKKAEEETVEAPTKGSPLRAARAAVVKVLKGDDPGIDVDPNALKESLPHLSTGSFVINYRIGGQPNQFGVSPCPGFPKGRMSQLYGHESSGKTTLALATAAGVCAKGGTVCFIDWENAIDISYAKSLGVPVEDSDRWYHVQPNTLEDGYKIAWVMAKSGVDLIVFDSVGAGIPKEVFEQKVDEQGEMGRVGLLAAKWSKFLPKLIGVISKSGTTILALSQLRKAIGTMGYGDDKTIQGGEAFKFYASVRLMLQRIGSEKAKVYNPLIGALEERNVGNKIRLKVEKSKVSAAQNSTAEFHISYGEGVDNVRSLIEIGSLSGVVRKSGSWYTFAPSSGEEMKAQGIEPLKALIRSNAAAWKELHERVNSYLLNVGNLAVPEDVGDAEEETFTVEELDL
jgi:recombination protein RecA